MVPETAPPLRWLLAAGERRRQAYRYWVRDVLTGMGNGLGHHLLRLLPVDACSAVGAGLGVLAAARYPRSTARALELMRRLRPDQDAQEALTRLWRHVGRAFAEYSVLDRILRQGRVTQTGNEHLQAALDSGRPIIALSLHLGHWEIFPARFSALYPTAAALYLVPPNRFEHRLVAAARLRAGVRREAMVPAHLLNARKMVRALKDGRHFLIHIDELIRGRVQAPAFGRPLRDEGNIAYVARLAAMTGAYVMPVYCRRLGAAARFELVFLPEIPIARDGDVIDNIAALNAVIEPVVAAHLDQWFYGLDFRFDN